MHQWWFTACPSWRWAAVVLAYTTVACTHVHRCRLARMHSPFLTRSCSRTQFGDHQGLATSQHPLPGNSASIPLNQMVSWVTLHQAWWGAIQCTLWCIALEKHVFVEWDCLCKHLIFCFPFKDESLGLLSFCSCCDYLLMNWLCFSWCINHCDVGCIASLISNESHFIACICL